MAKYLVETISYFRVRYVIEAKEAAHACDEALSVDVREVGEFGQKHIDENIFSVREIKDEEIPALFLEDNPFMEKWGDEAAFERVHTIDYGEIA